MQRLPFDSVQDPFDREALRGRPLRQLHHAVEQLDFIVGELILEPQAAPDCLATLLRRHPLVPARDVFRAWDNAIATAWSCDFTTGPDLEPECSWPLPHSDIVVAIFALPFGPMPAVDFATVASYAPTVVRLS
jgi:hypothetical protein